MLSDYEPSSIAMSLSVSHSAEIFVMKKFAVALAVAGMSAAAMAEGSSGFDPSSLMTTATSTVTGIVTALGTLLAAGAGIYISFIAWRAFKAACNKV